MRFNPRKYEIMPKNTLPFAPADGPRDPLEDRPGNEFYRPEGIKRPDLTKPYQLPRNYEREKRIENPLPNPPQQRRQQRR